MSRIPDATDRRILRQLQNNGRISNVDLARHVNLSPAACWARVRQLEEEGVIDGYYARLDPVKMGVPLLAFVEVVLDRTTPDVFAQFREAVLTKAEIMECHMVAGGFDYLVKVRVRDMIAYRTFLEDSLVTLPGVRETHTYAVMEEVKNSQAIPIPAE